MSLSVRIKNNTPWDETYRPPTPSIKLLQGMQFAFMKSYGGLKLKAG